MKANGFITDDQYFQCERAGRGSNPRLTKEQRRTVFTLYKEYHAMLKSHFHDHLDLEDYALLLLKHHEEIPDSLKYDYIFVDEVQDLQAMQLKALVSLQNKSIVVSGDPKQRIYKRSPFSYRELGLHIEGRRNRSLKTNYRSTREIMSLASGIKFMDEENDRMDDQKFVKEGPKPIIHYFLNNKKINQHLIKEIKSIQSRDMGASIAVIHRYDADQHAIQNSPIYLELNRNFDVITTAAYGRRFNLDTAEKKPIVFTDAFSVKGLEFDYVFLMHFDREHYPNQKRIEELNNRAGDSKTSESYRQDFDVILNDEKKVLYVAITRAKKEIQLMYSGSDFKRISQFIRDFDLHSFNAKGFDPKIYCK